MDDANGSRVAQASRVVCSSQQTTVAFPLQNNTPATCGGESFGDASRAADGSHARGRERVPSFGTARSPLKEVFPGRVYPQWRAP